MARQRLGGVVAARRGWCRPDEAIRFVVACTGGGVRYDVGGLTWLGSHGSQGMAEGAERTAGAVGELARSAMHGDEPMGTAVPRAVYSAPNPQGKIMRARTARPSSCGWTPRRPPNRS